ncbi:MAG: phosphotyrosine protein phosphatase [SAR86 cluster bacterium]|uniref:protein-tyrosine-phosphatase n=1 Tax=SAR86 cluster bacterium TaxID=2030880 RepID=A0A2A5AUN4_9GAMM|nr:MAG: phosphotyrosine protein phosphatase [SAR86 cluster bacterium]
MKSESQSGPVVKVLMVCLGNICRSPSAHGVFDNFIKNKNLSSRIEVDSAGTSNYHIGQPPDPRSIDAAAQRGYALYELVARQVQPDDYLTFDYILAMDKANLNDLKKSAPAQARARLSLLLAYSNCVEEVVPDPYYSGDDGFEHVLDLIEGACAGLMEDIHSRHLSTSTGATNSPS